MTNQKLCNVKKILYSKALQYHLGPAEMSPIVDDMSRFSHCLIWPTNTNLPVDLLANVKVLEW